MSNHENTESLSLGSTSPLRDKLIAIEAWLFTQQRIRLYGSGAVVAYAISLTVRFYQHRWMFHPDGTPECGDLSGFWVSGTFAGSGEPSLAYDYLAFSAARAALSGVSCMPAVD